VTRRWKFSPQVTADAEEIWRWMAEDSPRAADALLASFDQAMGILSDFPRDIRPDLL
jgi:plasmid stabilization system protein ParE